MGGGRGLVVVVGVLVAFCFILVSFISLPLFFLVACRGVYEMDGWMDD